MLFCKLQIIHSMMAQKEQFCPVCRKNDLLTRLELCQVNLTTAVYMCKLQGCEYPKGHAWIYVHRNIFDNDTSDDDDFEHDLRLNETNIDKCDISSKLIKLKPNLETKHNSNILKNEADISIPKVLDESKITQLQIREQKSTQMSNETTLDARKTLIHRNISPTKIIKILRVDILPVGNLTQIKPSNDIKKRLRVVQTAKVSKNRFANRVVKQVETQTVKKKQVEIENNEDAQAIKRVPIVQSSKKMQSATQKTKKVQINKLNVLNKIEFHADNSKEIENKLDLASVFTRKYNYKCKLDKVKPKKLRNSLVKQVKDLSKTPNITNIIEGHSKHINKASTFEGFQFHTNVIKPANETLNSEPTQKTNKNALEVEVKTSQIPETNKSQKDELEILVLDDFFSDIDNIQPIPVPENTVTDIDDWLQNL